MVSDRLQSSLNSNSVFALLNSFSNTGITSLNLTYVLNHSGIFKLNITFSLLDVDIQWYTPL